MISRVSDRLYVCGYLCAASCILSEVGSLSRKNGHLLINGDLVSLPQISQPLGQTSKPVPENQAQELPSSNKGGSAGPSSTRTAQQQPDLPKNVVKHKHAIAAETKPGVKSDVQLTAAATKAPSKKKKQKKAPADAAGSGPADGVPETGEAGHASQPTDPAIRQVAIDHEPTHAHQGAKKKKKRKNPETAVVPPAQSSLAAAATAHAAAPAGKRRKKMKESKQAVPPVQDADAAKPAAADHTAKKRKKKARNQASPDQAAQPAAEESMEKQKAPAAIEGQKAAVANMPDASGVLEAAETELSWRQDMKRKDVKRGRFSACERDTIRQAVQVCNAMHACVSDCFVSIA